MMTYGAVYSKPEPVRYHPFKSLPLGGWSAQGWYDGGGAKALPKAPRGWRWLELGESAAPRDLCCDPRSHPVIVVCGMTALTPKHHPILGKLGGDR